MNARQRAPAADDLLKGYRRGTHRARAPEETLARLRPLLPSLGVTRVANVTGLDDIGVPVVMACRPNSRSLATSQGKGLTLAAAQVSAIMESVELHHAERIDLPLILGSWSELHARRTLCDVARLPSITNSRYSPDLQILWIEGRDLMQQRSVWAPFETVHATAKVPAPMGSGCFAATSNGLASGNHLTEAVLHGLYEVIERDAMTLWELGSAAEKAASRLELGTVDDEGCRWVISRCASAGVTVAVWNTTSDVGAPSFLCEIRDPARRALGVPDAFIGMGTHAAREVALLRALTEAVQCRLTLISGSRDDLFRREYANRLGVGRLAADLPEAAPPGPGLDFRGLPTFDSDSFQEDLDLVLAQLAGAGLESAVVVDLTQPAYGLAVARVVVPGLEGPFDDPEYVPGARARSRRSAA